MESLKSLGRMFKTAAIGMAIVAGIYITIVLSYLAIIAILLVLIYFILEVTEDSEAP